MPPPGLPPPRPPGPPPRAEDRSRAVRFDGHHKARAHSCDDGALAQRHAAREVDEEVDVGAGGGGGHMAGHGGHHMLVAVRCRKLLPHEGLAGGRAVLRVSDNNSVILEDPQTTAADDYLRINKSKERRYVFDETFSENAVTRQVFERTARVLIGGVLQGFNATVFAYGATGAGKTHTMLGNPAEPGIMMLTLQDLFHEVDQQREDRQFEVKCSFLEVYNENIRDLMCPDGDYLDIREDPVKGMCVAGISEIGGLESATEIMALLHQANKHRTTEATGANVVSSRSHAVLQVVVEQRERTADIVAQVNVGKLSMIDLAGSERASQTANKGMRLIEGANINRSLLALGNCINALSSGVAFVPYRDSKMTRLLKDSLGGNCRTVMIANVSPCHLNYEDTHNTLKYANRAKNIKTKAVRNVVQAKYHVSKYADIMRDLQSEITELKGKLASARETPASGVELMDFQDPSGGSEGSGNPAAPHVQNGVAWKQELMQNFEERMSIKRQLINLAQVAQSQMVQKSQAQVGISQWESEQSFGIDEVSTPQAVREMQEQLRSIKAAMEQTEETTRELEQLLADNQQRAEALQAELPKRVQNKDMRSFLGLVSRIYVLEVENMDLQEMNDATRPLIQQKDLEAEALRLQIEMRDRMIQEQGQALQQEGMAPLPKPEGWMELPPAPSRRLPSPTALQRTIGSGSGPRLVHGRDGRLDPADDALVWPARQRGAEAGPEHGARRRERAPTPHAPITAAAPLGVGPPSVHQPISARTFVEGPAPPRWASGARDDTHAAVAPPGLPPRSPSVPRPPGATPLPAMGGAVTPPIGLDADLPQLDIAGRGLAPAPVHDAVRDAHQAQPPASPPKGPISSPSVPVADGQDGRLRPVVGVSAVPRGRAHKKHRWKEKNSREKRERERQLARVHVEASRVPREKDDAMSVVSDSEVVQEAVPARDAHHKDSVAERRGIIEKLNRRMKPPSSAHAAGPKSLN